MGRLNYVNRKIDGVKLSQAVSKDLYKRLPPHIGCKAAFRDPVLELDVSGKKLTDQGLSELSSGLIASLNYDGAQGRCARLEELCLKENSLSIASLRTLIPIIRLASSDIRDLDLSRNDINVNTEDEGTIWESFLKAFERCCKLRRIDLSGNPLGPKAYEALHRVYAIKSSVNPTRPSGSEECEDQKLEKHIATLEENALPSFNTMIGLRSVPYLILSDTAMTDTCALNLSFIIANHYLPSQLLEYVPAAKAGQQANQIVAYDEDSRCRGIVYHPNQGLGNAGLKVLDLAERRRDSGFGTRENVQTDPPKSPAEMSTSQRRTSRTIDKVSSTTLTKCRRSTIHPESLDRHFEAGDLDSARARIEGDTLQEVGPQSNKLWWSALRMLVSCRNIQPQTSHNSLLPPLIQRVKPPIIKTLAIPGIPKQKKSRSLASSTPLMTERDPNWRINPWACDLLKKSDSDPPDAHIAPTKLRRSDGEAASRKTPRAHVVSVEQARQYRTRLPCGFSEDIWRRVLAFHSGAAGILSDEQQSSVLRWAMDRNTLLRERDALGLTRAAQIWRVLEGTGCLAYAMNS